MSFPDCCSNIYHLHQHKFEFHNANASQVFNATLKELVEAIVCGKVETDAASLSTDTKNATTAIITTFFVLWLVIIPFMLFIFLKIHLNRNKNRELIPSSPQVEDS